MDALEVLRQMHVEAKAAFSEIESVAPMERAAKWDKLEPQLALHEDLEERFVYDPVAKDAGASDPVLARWESEHEQQVEQADAVMAKIDGLKPADDEWLRVVTKLHHTLEGHMKHEERDIWPRIREAWGDAKLAEVGEAMGKAKDAASA